MGERRRQENGRGKCLNEDGDRIEDPVLGALTAGIANLADILPDLPPLFPEKTNYQHVRSLTLATATASASVAAFLDHGTMSEAYHQPGRVHM